LPADVVMGCLTERVWNPKAMPPAQAAIRATHVLWETREGYGRLSGGQPQGGHTCPITAIRATRCTGMNRPAAPAFGDGLPAVLCSWWLSWAWAWAWPWAWDMSQPVSHRTMPRPRRRQHRRRPLWCPA
jgi:hypothetical protein